MKKYNLKFIVFIIVFLIAIFAFGCKNITNECDDHKEDNQVQHFLNNYLRYTK